MRQNTTPDQTAKLIELGIEPKQVPASCCWADDDNYVIGELIEMLSENVAKENEIPSTLNISMMHGEWCVQYADFLGTDFEFCNTELIDALYDMIVKLKEKCVI